MIVGVIALLAMPEAPAYLKRRVAYLETPAEDRSAPEQKQTADSQGGVVDALKFIFRYKQMRALLLCAFVFVCATGGTNYYESIMKTGGMTTEQITTMYFIPPVNAAMTALSGFITDKLGRKRSAAVLSGTALVGLVCFICSSGFGLLVGISYGLFIGGLWSAADILFILLPGESTPHQSACFRGAGNNRRWLLSWSSS